MPKRLAVLHSGDLDKVSPGGMDQYVKNLITGLPGYEITLFGTTPAGKFTLGVPVAREYGGIPYVFVPLIDDSAYPLTPRYMRALASNKSLFSDYDCIFAQRIEFSLPFAMSPLRHRLVQIVHGSSASAITHMSRARGRAYLIAERASISIARRTIIILGREEAGMPYYLRRYRRHRDRIVYGHIPVDLSAFYPRDVDEQRRRLGIPGNSFVIVYSGRVEDMPKRVLSYPAVSKLLDFDHRFVIVGDGSSLAELKRLVDELSVSKNFIYAGYVSDRKLLAEYVSAADVTINISTDEGTCTSVLESVACGVPVVSTDTGDVRNVVHDGANGIVIPNIEERRELAESAANAIKRVRALQPPMDDSYRQYEKTSALAELAQLLGEVTK